MTPIPIDKFNEGKIAHRKKIQDNILLVLEENPDSAFSSKDLEDMFDCRRQGICQALRALDRRGLIERSFIMEDNHLITYATIKK